jgi:hypothetical protein
VTSSQDNAGTAVLAPPPASPRSDAISAACALVFAILVVVLSWRMDRLESQGGSLWTAPGLWPGIVGLLLGALAAALLVRSWQRAAAIGWDTAEANDTPLVPTPRFVAAASLFFLYGIGLVGRGLPFWLGTAAFVAFYIYAFYDGPPGRSRPRRLAVALAIGAATALVVTLVFERVFLVRLP